MIIITRALLTSLLDERVPSDLKKNLMQARLDKKMTQAQLAQVLFEH